MALCHDTKCATLPASKKKRVKVLYPVKKGQSPTHSFSKGRYSDLVMHYKKKKKKKKVDYQEMHKKQWEGNAKYQWRVNSGELVQGMSKRACATQLQKFNGCKN